MARIRSVKPEFWTDEKVVELSFPARLLFIGLWNFADDDGRMVYSPKRIKMQVFPADSVDVSELVGEIRGNSMVETYTVAGVEYLQISNFHKHQRIDKRSPSKLPSPQTYRESPQPTQNPSESPRIPTTDGSGGEVDGRGNGITAGQEPSAPSPAAVELIPLQDGTDFQVTADFVAELDRAYPAVDIPQTLREIRAWNLSNPGKRKTLRGVRKHIHTWVAGEQQKAGAH